MPSLSRQTFYNIEALFPPPDEQTAIADILATVDRAIEQTEALIAKQRRIKAGLLHDLLTRGIDEHGRLRDPSTHRFKPSPVGLVPEEWEVEKLASYADVLGGKRLPAGHNYTEVSTGYRFLRVLDFYEKTISFSDLANLEEATFQALERYEIANGDLFIAIAGSIGFCGVLRVSGSDRIILTENAAKIRLRSDFAPEFLAMQINGHRIQQQIIEAKGTGGGVPKLALFRIENLYVARLSMFERSRMVKHFPAAESALDDLAAELAKLNRLKAGLMQDLLSGRVSVAELAAAGGQSQEGCCLMPASHTLIHRLVHIENLSVLLQRRGLHAPTATPADGLPSGQHSELCWLYGQRHCTAIQEGVPCPRRRLPSRLRPRGRANRSYVRACHGQRAQP